MTPDATTLRPKLVFILCFLAGLCEGYDLLVAGITAPKFAPVFGLAPDQLGMVFSASTLGLFVGALVGGRIADYVGRRWVLIGSLLALGVFSIGSALVSDTNSLLAMRFLTGLGLGGTLPNILALVNETSRPGTATMRVTMLGSAMPFGGAILGVLTVILPDLDWKTVFIIGGAAPIAVAALMMFLLPESPAFLSRKQAGASAQARPTAREAIAGDGRLRSSLFIWSASLLVALSLYLMVNWLPSLMVAKGFDKADTGKIIMLLTFGGAASGFAFGALSRMRNRYALYIATWLGMALSTLAMAFAGPSLLIAAAASFGIGFFMSGGQFLLYALSTELYPAPVRGTGVGLAVGIARLGAVAGPLLAGVLLAGNRSVNEVILAVVPIVLISLMTALLLLNSTPTSPKTP